MRSKIMFSSASNRKGGDSHMKKTSTAGAAATAAAAAASSSRTTPAEISFEQKAQTALSILNMNKEKLALSLSDRLNAMDKLGEAENIPFFAYLWKKTASSQAQAVIEYITASEAFSKESKKDSPAISKLTQALIAK